jgi:hypothetical protein
MNAQQTFVVIFRQGPPSLTDTDKQRRAEETVPWAQSQNSAGHKLKPYILAPESACHGLVTGRKAQPLTLMRGPLPRFSFWKRAI